MAESTRPTWRSTSWAIAGSVVVALLLIGSTVAAPPEARPYLSTLATVIAVSMIVWAAVRTRSQRRTYEDELTTWAARQAIQSERLHVARDLHDLVSHSLGRITLRTAAARRQMESGIDVDHARVLADVEDASREATVELRRMLGLLRDENAESAPLRPAARLDDLPELVNESRRFGLRAELHMEQLGAVSPGVQTAVHAIVREALANTARHAGPAGVTVDVRRDGDVIVVSVHDTGPVDRWTSRPGARHGLNGLKERATNLGGTLFAEPTGTGFHLTARLPDPVAA